MDQVIESRLITVLKEQVRLHGLKSGFYSDTQINQFENEKRYLMNEFMKLEEEDAWWSQEEWEWFLNRALDFLEGKTK